MNIYTKSVIFTFIIVITIWDITCMKIHSLQDPQFCIIKEESNDQSVQSDQPNHQSPSNNYENRRSNHNINPIVSATQSSAAKSKNVARDYVNPQFQSRNILSIPIQPTSVIIENKTPRPSSIQSGSGSNRGAVRDYVNPSFSSSGQSSGSNFRPSPRNSKIGSSYANITSGQTTSNIRDYVISKPAFPPLPNRGISSVVQPSTSTSYASKVSVGGNTKVSTEKTLSIEQRQSSTTARPDDGPSDAELREFSEALLKKDVNNAAKYVTINVQGKTTSQSQNDEAPEKLLFVNPEAYEIPTISKLKLLHNNYILDTNENEHVTIQEKSEENDLLDAILSTPIMQQTRQFLISKEKVSKDPKDFRDLLKLLWFNMYSRGGGKIGSSGFEHIFLAEIKKKEVSGLHNWVFFNEAERNALVDYFGYMKKLNLGEQGSILKFRFKLNGIDKLVGSMFIGTSPELEMALYTTCFMFRADRICPLRLNGSNFIVRTFKFRYRGKNLIGSAFPEI